VTSFWDAALDLRLLSLKECCQLSAALMAAGFAADALQPLLLQLVTAVCQVPVQLPPGFDHSVLVEDQEGAAAWWGALQLQPASAQAAAAAGVGAAGGGVKYAAVLLCMQKQLLLLPEELQALLVPAAAHMVTQHLETWQQQVAGGPAGGQRLSIAQLEQVEAAVYAA